MNEFVPNIHDWNHLIGLCRALRTAESGNKATGEKPDKERAVKLRTALDIYLAEHWKDGYV